MDVFQDMGTSVAARVLVNLKLSLRRSDRQHNAVLPLFIHDDGRVLLPAARSIWEKLLSEPPELTGYLDSSEAEIVYQRMHRIAEQQSRAQFEQLLQKHTAYIESERQKTEYSFQARRRAIERLGLPEVRSYRLKQLVSEEEIRYRQIDLMAEIHPVLQPYLLLRIQ